MKKSLILLSALLFSASIYAQILNPTSSISASGTADAFKGGYTFAYAASGTPWNGSLLSFGGFSNNYDTQINSDYGEGKHLSFRTRNGDFNNGAGQWNSWNEIWHSGNLNNANSDFNAKILNASVLSSNNNNAEGGVLSLSNQTKTGTANSTWRIYNTTGQYGNSLQFWGYSADGSNSGVRLKISDAGDMALPHGKFEAKEVKVTTTPTADFVFEEDYNLPKLEEVEKHIKEKKHLPEIASAKEMEKEGVNVGEFQIKLLQKIEELTLYSIEQNKKIKTLQSENKDLKSLLERVEKLEKSARN